MLDPVTDRQQNDVVTGKQNDLNPGSSTRNGAVTQNICRQDGDIFFLFSQMRGAEVQCLCQARDDAKCGP